MNVIVVVALHLSLVNFVFSLTVKSFHNMLVDDCECVESANSGHLLVNQGIATPLDSLWKSS